LLASTFLGGSDDDNGNSLILDTSGNVYVTGSTYSSDFPTTSGAYDTFSDGSAAFISKLNGGLTDLLASTFLGGSNSDYGYSMALDTSGNVYVTGYTSSSDFPTTSEAYDTSFNGTGDVFVSKLNGRLTDLLASTFLGGSNSDYGYSMALDTSGNIYVTGCASSLDFPTTSGAYDTSFYGSSLYAVKRYDAFISKMNDGLTDLLASTSLGGSGNYYGNIFYGQDYGRSLALDTSGNVYVMGYTQSTDFPTTSGAYDTSNGGYYDDYDVFITKLNSGLTSLLASTFLGGSNSDYGYSMALDMSGNVYVTGVAYSSDFPTTSGAYDTSSDGSDDVFISKLNSGLTSLLASTYLGESATNCAYSLALDISENVYVTGKTNSPSFPTTSGAYDTSYDLHSSDDFVVFISKLDGNLSGSAFTPTPNASPTSISTPSPSQTCSSDGDVNEDGKLTAGDALLAFKSVLGSTTLTSCQESHADVNGNGKVTAADALCIFKAVLKGESLSESLSCE